MGRVRIAAIAAVCVSCAGRHAAPCPRPTDTATGIPRLLSGSANDLLTRPNRKCQVVFEPAFSPTHAVYVVAPNPQEPATVVVAVRQIETIATYSAPLDARTFSFLDELCTRFLTEGSFDCARRGVDGTWFHFAHTDWNGSYLARSIWSPRHDSDAAKLVDLAEALRDYGMAPESLRAVYWQRLNRAILAP